MVCHKKLCEQKRLQREAEIAERRKAREAKMLEWEIQRQKREDAKRQREEARRAAREQAQREEAEERQARAEMVRRQALKEEAARVARERREAGYLQLEKEPDTSGFTSVLARCGFLR